MSREILFFVKIKRNKMSRGFKIFITILLVLLFFFLFRVKEERIFNFSYQLQKRIEERINEFIVREAKKQISAPPALLSYKDSLEGNLTPTGVILWTNVEREKNGLPLLRENFYLDASAKAKLKDMFENQYFAHYSTSGVGVGELAQRYGYEFIAVGENLALGNFKDDQDLVQEWMASPPHRRNILNSRYQDIGVAVGRGIFEGKPTWIAVQHFGLPLSACPQPEEGLKEKIEANQEKLRKLQILIENLQEELKSIRPKWSTAYKQKVAEYNNLVEKYNTLLEETKILVNEYNNQVKIFNNCVAGE